MRSENVFFFRIEKKSNGFRDGKDDSIENGEWKWKSNKFIKNRPKLKSNRLQSSYDKYHNQNDDIVNNNGKKN